MKSHSSSPADTTTQPDTRQTPALHEAGWQVLDEASQWRLFSQTVASDGDTTLIESQFILDGLHCAACSGIIESGLNNEPGVQKARVSLSKNRGVVTWSPAKTKPSRILQKIHELGYQGMPATQLGEHNRVLGNKRKAFWRWMVAGFCTMQVMMYAIPGYLSNPGDISAEMTNLLRWASWLLSLPVLLFSSQLFFKNAWFDLKHLRVSMDLPLAIGILITFSLSSLATFYPNGWWGETVYFDSMCMLVFFLLSARLIEARLHSKTMGGLETLLNRIPDSTTLIKPDGQQVRILNQNLSQGDIVQVATGEAFPADGNLTLGSTQADESLLTGESKPIDKPAGSTVIAGSINIASTVQMRVASLGKATRYGQIVQLIEKAALEKPRLSKIADRIAKPFLIFVLVSAGLAAALMWQTSPAKALVTAATVLIVTCPCALSLATPAAMLASASAMIKRGILVNKLQAIENLSTIDMVIFDKTGTLTEHEMAVTQIQTAATIDQDTALSIAAALAAQSQHPVAQAVYQHYINCDSGEPLPNIQSLTEHTGAGITAELNDGAVLPAFKGVIKLGSADFCQQANTKEQAVYLICEQQWLATFYLSEQLKPEVKQTINWLNQHQYQTVLLSGDQSEVVQTLAKELQFDHYQAACTPQDKLAFLAQAKRAGKKAVMVGDGLNDGPILASAQVSIAMGQGVALAQSHADLILTNNNVGKIPNLFLQANKTMQVIKQNIIWAVLYNMVCVPLAFMGLLTPWLAGLGMATSSLVVILNAVRLGQFSRVTSEEGK